MDIDRFIGTNSQVWDQLAELVARAERRGVGRLDGAELDELVRLYQRVATHLSYARTEFRDPALSAKLSRLVARSGAVVYGSRPRTLRSLGRFFAVTFPAAVREAYVNHDFQDYYPSKPAADFAAHVFSNNVLVAFEAFALGILGCVGTLYVLLT